MQHKSKIRPYVEQKVHFESVADRAIRLSNRQLCLLRAIDEAPHGQVGLEELAHFNQGTVGANRRREWVAEKKHGHAVGITPEGKAVLRAFQAANFLRKVASTNFSSYLRLEPPENLAKALKKDNPGSMTARRLKVVSAAA